MTTDVAIVPSVRMLDGEETAEVDASAGGELFSTTVSASLMKSPSGARDQLIICA